MHEALALCQLRQLAADLSVPRVGGAFTCVMVRLLAATLPRPGRDGLSERRIIIAILATARVGYLLTDRLQFDILPSSLAGGI
jgi:hypothetical protein